MLTDRKTQKKLNTTHQYLCDIQKGFQTLSQEIKGQRFYTEALHRIDKELAACIKRMEMITGNTLEATDKESRDIQKTLKYFSLRRVFATKYASVKENARQNALLDVDEKGWKDVILAENRIAETLHRLELQAKKQKEIEGKLKL